MRRRRNSGSEVGEFGGRCKFYVVHVEPHLPAGFLRKPPRVDGSATGQLAKIDLLVGELLGSDGDLIPDQSSGGVHVAKAIDPDRRSKSTLSQVKRDKFPASDVAPKDDGVSAEILPPATEEMKRSVEESIDKFRTPLRR